MPPCSTNNDELTSVLFSYKWRLVVGSAIPNPRYLFVLSQKKFVLSSERIPEVPAKITDPVVGANHVGEPVPPDMRACPLVPAEEICICEALLQTIPPFVKSVLQNYSPASQLMFLSAWVSNFKYAAPAITDIVMIHSNAADAVIEGSSNMSKEDVVSNIDEVIMRLKDLMSDEDDSDSDEEAMCSEFECLSINNLDNKGKADYIATLEEKLQKLEGLE